MTAQIGRSIPRLEARAKVTRRAEYAHNLRLPGMLYGKVFRSTVAHGRIRAIDGGATAALDGVVRVVTGEDIRKRGAVRSTAPRRMATRQCLTPRARPTPA
jgi:CO/xanthine dehydrogenase Mo-binding subunit